MSTDPLAILDSPKITADEYPLPFTDDAPDDFTDKLAEVVEAYDNLRISAAKAADELEAMRLVRCAGCDELFRGDSQLLSDHSVFPDREMTIGHRLVLCTECVKAIDRRSYGMQPSDFPLMLSGSGNYAPLHGIRDWSWSGTLDPQFSNTLLTSVS